MVVLYDEDLRVVHGNLAALAYYREASGSAATDTAALVGLDYRRLMGEARSRASLPHLRAALGGRTSQVETLMTEQHGGTPRMALRLGWAVPARLGPGRPGVLALAVALGSWARGDAVPADGVVQARNERRRLVDDLDHRVLTRLDHVMALAASMETAPGDRPDEQVWTERADLLLDHVDAAIAAMREIVKRVVEASRRAHDPHGGELLRVHSVQGRTPVVPARAREAALSDPTPRHQAPDPSALASCLRAMPAIVAVFDAAECNVYANDRSLAFLGCRTAEEAHGRSLADLIGPELYAANRRLVQRALAGESQSFPREVVDAGGSVRHLAVQYVPFGVAPDSGLLVFAVDVTEQMTAEERITRGVSAEEAEDRERTARRLHDDVIQRLFVAGLRLGTALALEDPVRGLEVVAEGVQEVRAAQVELVRAIEHLADAVEPSDVRAELARAVDEAIARHGFPVSLVYVGLLRSLPGPVMNDLLAVVREALQNAARHGHARHAEVTVEVRDDVLQVRVEDDGSGIAPSADRGEGMATLMARAARAGGGVTWSAGSEGGTVVTWWAALGAGLRRLP